MGEPRIFLGDRRLAKSTQINVFGTNEQTARPWSHLLVPGSSFGRAGMASLIGANFLCAINVICPVQTLREKHSASVVGQISTMTPRVSRRMRGGSRSSRTLRWDAVDAGVCERRTQHQRTAKSCGPGAPTLALSFLRSDGGKKARSPGRARRKP
jgi:hypothetical protein